MAVIEKPKKIMLNARALNHFALAARTSRGQMLRDFVLSLVRGVKRLAEAIAVGAVELRAGQPSAPNNQRANNRLRACNTNVGLMNAVKENHPDVHGSTYGRMNGETNKSITGFYSYEMARQIGVPAREVNMRDRMTQAQLALTEAAELISAELMNDISGTGENPIEAHKRVLDSMCSDEMKAIAARGGPRQTGQESLLSVKDARKAMTPTPTPVIQNQPTVPPITINNIHNYFSRAEDEVTK